MKHFFLLALCSMLGLLAGQAQTYRNPIIALDGPDPTVQADGKGNFYLLATGERIWKSRNLVDWTMVGEVFTPDKRPTFVPGVTRYWAPDLNRIKGRWVLYYSLSKWNGIDSCGIGVATSKKIEGPYEPVGDGKLFRSYEIGVRNSIDQFYIEDGGRKWLAWGSFNGIYIIELTRDGLRIKPGAEKRKIAGTAYEGSYIYKRNGYYYYFGSTGTCCSGARSTYRVVYGRSKSLFGPYLNKAGESLMDNKYEVLVHGNERFAGPGHNAEIITDKAGQTWMPYHAYMVAEPDRGRVVLLDQVKWQNDWPYIEGGVPSDESACPVF